MKDIFKKVHKKIIKSKKKEMILFGALFLFIPLLLVSGIYLYSKEKQVILPGQKNGQINENTVPTTDLSESSDSEEDQGEEEEKTEENNNEDSKKDNKEDGEKTADDNTPTKPVPTPTPSFTPQKLRVIEVRYFPKGESAGIYHPNTLSTNLKSLVKQASSGQVEVEIVKVYNNNTARPNPDGNWYSTYAQILEDHNLCSQIKSLDIDQIWLWVDPRAGYDTGPGMEYAISSNYFVKNVQYATFAFVPFCGGDPGFVFMGFDTTRTADLALHSFGHYMEGMLGNLQGNDLFWYKFSGIDSAGYQHEERCGNVHFPPNGQSDYDYANQTNVSNSCEDWNTSLSGQKLTYNCSKWGCNQEGYLVWWMKRMPLPGNSLAYSGGTIPPWWDFVTDMDSKIASYNSNTKFYMNRSFITANKNSGSCSCSGSDYNGNPVTINTCGGSIVGGDSSCYMCTSSGWKVVSNSLCN